MKYIGIIAFLSLFSCNTPVGYPEGGYSYPEKLASYDSNFYYYPLKDSLTKRDSLLYKHSDVFFYTAFHESNLSLRPLGEVVFRFVYSSVMDRPVIFTLTEDNIVVKQGIKGYAEPYYNNDRLTEKEKFHYSLFERYYPLNEARLEHRRARYLDSLISIYPEMLSTAYYKSLLDKANDYDVKQFRYSTTTVPISINIFNQLISKINASGYWSLPYRIHDCVGMLNDGYGFSLEANTPKKYKVVFKAGCPDDTSKFTLTCQELLTYAGLQNRIQLHWNWNRDTVSEPIEIQEVQLEDTK